MITDTQATRAVKQAFKDMAAAYTARNEAALRKTLADDLVMYGTGSDEVAHSAEEMLKIARRDWSQAERGTFKPKNIHAHANGNVGWLEADADFDVVMGGQPLHMDARATAVFHREKGNWRLVQGHVSLPAAAQAEGQAFPQQPQLEVSGQTLVH